MGTSQLTGSSGSPMADTEKSRDPPARFSLGETARLPLFLFPRRTGNHHIERGKQGTPCPCSIGVNSLPAFSDGLVETERFHGTSRRQEVTS